MAGTIERWLGIVALTTIAACNFITGADDVELTDDEDETTGGPSSGSSGTTGGDGGAGVGGATSGAGGATSGVGGAMGGPGGAGTTTTTVATTSSSASSSSSGGGEMCGGAGPSTTPLDAEEQAFLQIINAYRAQNSLGPLTACVSLNRAAQGHSEDMRDNDYFSHTGQNNSSPWDRACDACFDQGCGPTTAMAENIAAGNSGAQGTFDQWKNSPGHNANMLNGSFTMIGIGRASGGGTYGVYWTNVFAGNDEPSCF